MQSRQPSNDPISTPQPMERVWHLLRDPAAAWSLFRAYLGFGRRLKQFPVTNVAELGNFLDSRATFVAQTSLYGYLRTRAGQRYPELFEDLGFVQSINRAKWQIWLACLSDLSIFAGGLLTQSSPGESTAARAGGLIATAVDQILAQTGIPADAGPDFATAAAELRKRVADCDWANVVDGDSTFTESPAAVVKWAPIVDNLKTLDEPIVLNSVRFRWQEIRRDLRRSLRPSSILEM